MSLRLLAGAAFFVLSALPCLTQTEQTPPPATADSTPNTQPSSASPASPKKVWTNDDIHARNGVSVVGDKRSQNYHMTPGPTADSATVSRIRKNLEKLTAQLDDANEKLAGLKKFQAGDEVKDPGPQINKGLNRVPVDQQIAQLEASKKKLEGQISDLLDEARKKGIDPGQLR
ncbi:MAG TPA: hypothetical protein VMH31_14570 [Methylomirabilota bacterium]|nr:hypothetical protein [Methylomirabilota bacterium]